MEETNFDNATLKDGFAGDRRYLKGFLAKIDLIFLLYPERYPDDASKVIYLISRFYGQAMNWAATLIEKADPCLNDYSAFVSKLKAFYGSNDSTYVANQMLRTLRQHTLGGIRGYINEFNKYADESSWNEQAKMDAFIAGLNNQVALKILEMFPGPRDLISLQTIASRIDSRLATRKIFLNNNNYNYRRNKNQSKDKKYKNNKGKSQTQRYSGPLSKEEKERRKKENLCLYCGSPSHQLNECPKRIKKESENVSFMSILTSINRPRTNNTQPERATSEFKLSYRYL